MDNSLRDMHERLVDHLDGLSTAEESRAIESLISTDPVWAKAWHDLQETRAAIRHFGLKQRVGRIHQEMKEVSGSSSQGVYRRMFRPFLSVAAALLLLLAGYYFYKFYTISPENVYGSSYVTYDLGTLRGNVEKATELETAFRNKDHRAVLQLLSQMTDASHKEKFLAGISSMEVKDYPKAISLFNEILADKQEPGLFKDEAEYYLALASIAIKDYDKALVLLKKIRSEKQHLFHQEVDEDLISDVRMLKWK